MFHSSSHPSQQHLRMHVGRRVTNAKNVRKILASRYIFINIRELILEKECYKAKECAKHLVIVKNWNHKKVCKKAFKLRENPSSNTQIIGAKEFTLHISSGGEKEAKDFWQFFPPYGASHRSQWWETTGFKEWQKLYWYFHTYSIWVMLVVILRIVCGIIPAIFSSNVYIWETPATNTGHVNNWKCIRELQQRNVFLCKWVCVWERGGGERDVDKLAAHGKQDPSPWTLERCR